jgi:hypothetical protein
MSCISSEFIRDKKGSDRMRRGWLITAAAVATTALMGTVPVQAADCVAGTVATYTTAFFSCNVGPVTFSNFQFFTSGGATIDSITPVSGSGEYGLSLHVTSAASGSNSDIKWNYNAAAQFLTDAFASLNGFGTNGGFAALDEFITQTDAFGASVGEIHLKNPGGKSSDTIFFSPQSLVYASKDQLDFANCLGCTAQSSEIVNAWSVNVPVPIVGAGLPGLLAACGGLVLLAKRRRRGMMA